MSIVVSLTAPKAPAVPAVEGLRPVNLRTDLAPLADLIELSFADTMDSGGRAAIRELRALSKIGTGLQVLAGMEDMRQGIAMGYVYIVGGRLIGNVSIYPAEEPRALGQSWAIANVAVHPDYRGRGIARELMRAALVSIRTRTRLGRPRAILQVDTANSIAQHLYLSLGFRAERAFTHWKRSSSHRLPPPFDMRAAGLYMTRRRPGEWRAEYALAALTRPAQDGGIGWMRPLHVDGFRPSWRRALSDLINMRTIERLVIRHPQNEHMLRGALWIESAFASSTTTLTLLIDPALSGMRLVDEAFINHAVRRFGDHSTIVIDHPMDDTAAGEIFSDYGFRAARKLLHMRWEG